MNGNPLPPKKEVALALLERGSVHVHLDPRAVGVVVPAWFKRQPSLVLQVGLNMAVPIPDLRVDDDGMSCTLSFNRSPFFCIVPWSAAYAMVGDDGRGMIWPEDVPPEVALQGRSREAEAAAKKATPERTLAVVKSGALPSAKPKRGPRPRPSDDAQTTKAPVAKKSRARKPRTDAPDVAATEARQEPGVLIAIPSKPAKPARRVGTPAPKAPAATRRPVPVPARAEAPPPSPPPRAPSPPKTIPQGSPNGGKPGGGKPKREIPPYLRVVK
jgi:stringent starvation protein B